MRVKITLSYDGSKFNGFQRQNSGVKTVANKLEKIFKSLKIEEKFQASGRTDTGVHATNQVIHVDLPEYWKDLSKLQYMLNLKALPDIHIQRIEELTANFHARYDAKTRVYRYIISDKKPSVFLTPYIHFVSHVDVPKIEDAMALFEGEYDFEYFKKTKGAEGSSVRVIKKCRFYRYKECYVFSFEANGYLRSQIRMMVYFLLEISDGRLTKEQLKEQLEKKRRHSTGVVKPNGLYLSKIKY